MTKAVQDLMVEVEQARDAFHRAVLAGDLDAAVAVVAEGCELVVRPVGTEARGRDAVRRHLAEEVVGHVPGDLTSRQVSRTGNRWTVVDETLVGFTHDRELPWLLPGVAPTGRWAEVLAITVVTVRKSRVTHHRTLWDHAALVEQLGLLGAIPAR